MFLSAPSLRPRRLLLQAGAGLVALAILTAGASSAQAVAPASGEVQIDVGGSGDGATFVPDTYGSGGIVDTKPASVTALPNWSQTVTHPIPAAVWNTSRFTDSSYSVPGLTPGGSYQLRLYFMDWYFKGAGKRLFNVEVNGTRVLTDFDINGTAIARGADGGAAFGVERDFDVVADDSGVVKIDFLRGSVDQVQINAISIIPQ
ncbi:hypothetical protein GCM10022223_31740 [Kineosporia mesophila]|uniref:Malectin domain-containing protein n=1 Tax=Kineosporia mesophila TaxID=566012 RepID=A0ABP6ZL32_9ACTN|nr:malectin domain-containing carbohydrate-binding protein [Kineosporia mesophila]MCD5354499.1 malectin [Kineosporia mesophila]